jgi:membrane protease YdiL (CAAX protease family)
MENKKWIATSIVWALLMFLMNTIVLPLYKNEHITTLHILVGIFVWTIAGFAFGFMTRKILKQKSNSI